jgi:hypothetical protein
MTNFDDLFEAVESSSYDLSRNLDTIRYEIEGLTREYEELLNLLQVSDHQSAVEAIISLKSKRDLTAPRRGSETL